MSERRALRLTLTAMIIVSTTATIIATISPLDFTDGGAIFPIAAILSTVGLIAIRPKRNTKGSTK